MSEFLKSAKIFLKDASEDLTNGKFASCIVHVHLAMEHALKSRLMEREVDVRFKTTPELVNEALRLGLIAKQARKGLLNVNSLRNRIYHEGYIPRKHEAEDALKIAKKHFKDIL